jgi:hypothetical protein
MLSHAYQKNSRATVIQTNATPPSSTFPPIMFMGAGYKIASKTVSLQQTKHHSRMSSIPSHLRAPGFKSCPTNQLSWLRSFIIWHRAWKLKLWSQRRHPLLDKGPLSTSCGNGYASNNTGTSGSTFLCDLCWSYILRINGARTMQVRSCKTPTATRQYHNVTYTPVARQRPLSKQQYNSHY